MDNNFGEKIRVARVIKKLTQQQLADLVGVSRVVISKWENDTLRPTFQHLVKLSHILEIKEL